MKESKQGAPGSVRPFASAGTDPCGFLPLRFPRLRAVRGGREGRVMVPYATVLGHGFLKRYGMVFRCLKRASSPRQVRALWRNAQCCS